MKKSKKIHSLSKINPIKTIKEFRITKRTLRIVGCGVALAVLMTSAATPVFASGNVSGAIESTWNAAQSQIKQVVNNVVFPTESTVSLTLPHQLSCLRAFCSL